MFTRDFCNYYISSLERIPYLKRQALNELGPKLDWSLANRIAQRKHPAADPVTRFENCDG
jgi:hypothetical protein